MSKRTMKLTHLLKKLPVSSVWSERMVDIGATASPYRCNLQHTNNFASLGLNNVVFAL